MKFLVLFCLFFFSAFANLEDRNSIQFLTDIQWDQGRVYDDVYIHTNKGVIWKVKDPSKLDVVSWSEGDMLLLLKHVLLEGQPHSLYNTSLDQSVFVLP